MVAPRSVGGLREGGGRMCWRHLGCCEGETRGRSGLGGGGIISSGACHIQYVPRQALPAFMPAI